jgi:hypothetical protein
MSAALAAPAAAVTIPTLFNTGVNNAGVSVTGVGIADQHWTLTVGTAYVSATNGTFPTPPWLADNTVSRWITPRPSAGTSLDPTAEGFYVYKLDFSLAGYLPETASFSARFAVDNQVTSIMLNSTALTAPTGTFNSWTAFSATDGFIDGLNTLSIRVRNLRQVSGNPSGLRVEFTASDIAPLPEPGSWAMMIAGFGMIGFAMRRQSRPVRAAATPPEA